MEKIKAILSGNTISSNSQQAFNILSSFKFGEKSGEKVFYSIYEAFFLLREKKLDLFSKEKNLQEKEILKLFEKIDKNFESKFLVFQDMRRKGYILKTALKLGAEFRVYEKNHNPEKNHAKWLLFVVNETSPLKWHEYAAKNRVAHSTSKSLLIAVVDSENSISYYESKWISA